jgi:PKHD-type hydroxylase
MSYGYRGITNQSIQRAFVTHPYAYWDETFTSDELNKIIEKCSSIALDDSKTIDGNISPYRTSKNNFHHYSDETKWIFDRLNGLIDHVNNNFFNYDLNGYEFFQYAEYHAEDYGRYNYHTDISLGGRNLSERKIIDSYAGLETRKLSISLLLNEPGVDFEGGEFNTKVDDNDELIEFKKGRALFFPSYLLHKVSPVTKGVRKSLVIWVTGPKFR